MRALIPLVAAMCLSLSAQAQEIVIVTVRSPGQGVTEAAAIKDAIVEAVARVSGERINSVSTAQTQSRESSNGESRHSASFEQRIDSLVRGVVKSSRTISVGKDADSGVYKAVVDVDVAKYRHSEQLNRIKLAIVTGVQPLPYGLAGNAPGFADAVLNGTSDKLVTANKFAILDRRQRDTAQKEFARIVSGGAGVENFVRLQSAAVADFLVVVEVTDYTPSKSMLGNDRIKASARAIVYDYTSGQIRQAVTSTSTRIVRDRSPLGLASQLGAELAEKIIDNVFPARVIGFDNDRPIINAGLGQFDVGDRVRLYRQGQALRDPYTKEPLGMSESLVGEGVVDTVMPKIALVQLTGGQNKLPDFRDARLVVRRNPAEALQAIPGATTSLSEAAGRSSVSREKVNDDEKW